MDIHDIKEVAPVCYEMQEGVLEVLLGEVQEYMGLQKGWTRDHASHGVLRALAIHVPPVGWTFYGTTTPGVYLGVPAGHPILQGIPEDRYVHGVVADHDHAVFMEIPEVEISYNNRYSGGYEEVRWSRIPRDVQIQIYKELLCL